MIGSKRRAFTLAEILLVVGIVAILAAIAVPGFMAYRKTAHAKACADNIHMIRSACYANQVLTGRMETDLSKLVGDAGKGFLKWVPQCPVGGSYSIEYDASSEVLTISCSMDGIDEHIVSR